MTLRKLCPKGMLSKAEVQFLKGEKRVSGSYRRKIRERIRAKARSLRDELSIMALDPEIRPILGEALGLPSVTEIRHVTENRHAKTLELAGPAVSAPIWVRVHTENGEFAYSVRFFDSIIHFRVWWISEI